MKRWIKTILVLLTVTLIMPTTVAFGQESIAEMYQGSQDTITSLLETRLESELDVTSFIEQVKNAHEEFNEVSFTSNMGAYMEMEDYLYSGTLLANTDVAYESDFSLSYAYMAGEVEDNEGISGALFLLVTPEVEKMGYSKTTPEEEWQPLGEPGTMGNFYVYPDYIRLVQIIEILASDASLFETDTHYLFYVAGSEQSLFDIYQDEFEMSHEDIENPDFEESVLYTFDKETFFMENYYLNIYQPFPEGLFIDIELEVYDANNVDWQEFEAELENIQN